MESKWQFRGNEEAGPANAVMFGSHLAKLDALCDFGNPLKPVLRLGHGDPSVFPAFRTAIETEDAVVEAVRSAKFNHYPSPDGIAPAKKAIANYLNRDLPQKLTPNDVFLAVGCNQGTELILQALWRPNANILIPNPGYPQYECRAIYTKIEARKYDLLPERGWDFDYEGIERLADENTVAIAIINPHNPCGNVYSSQQLQKVAELARKLGVMVIADEVYRNIIYGPNPFVPMGSFSHIVPVITLGALSKGWIVPGWRLGWIAAHDHEGALKNTRVIHSLIDHLMISPSPTTFLQGALPGILENTKQEFWDEKCGLIGDNADYFYTRLKEIPLLRIRQKPEACTYVLGKLDLSTVVGIRNEVDFCEKLAAEENLVVLPGVAVGMKNWVRITIGVEYSILEDAFDRLMAFYQRHSV